MKPILNISLGRKPIHATTIHKLNNLIEFCKVPEMNLEDLDREVDESPLRYSYTSMAADSVFVNVNKDDSGNIVTIDFVDVSGNLLWFVHSGAHKEIPVVRRKNTEYFRKLLEAHHYCEVIVLSDAEFAVVGNAIGSELSTAENEDRIESFINEHREMEVLFKCYNFAKQPMWTIRAEEELKAKLKEHKPLEPTLQEIALQIESDLSTDVESHVHEDHIYAEIKLSEEESKEDTYKIAATLSAYVTGRWSFIEQGNMFQDPIHAPNTITVVFFKTTSNN